MTSNLWSNEQIGKLITMRMKGYGYRIISNAVGRTIDSCRNQVCRIKKTFKVK
jgi:hypothetical protein